MTNPTCFDHLPFPVFSATRKGLLFYKNSAAVRYIGALRRGSHVKRHLWNDTLPSSPGLIYLKGGTPYPHALAVQDEEELLFLCPARLQYPDAAEIAEALLRTVGKTPAAYRTLLWESNHIPVKDSQPRLYTEMRMLSPQARRFEEKAFHLGTVAGFIFEKASGRFGALGYRLQAEITEGFAFRHPIRICRYDLLFFFGVLLCTVMKLSETRDVRLLLESDTEKESHLFRLQTRTALPLSEKALSVWEILAEYAPSCTAELLLLGETFPFLSQVSMLVNPCRKLTLTWEIPYLAAMLPIQSPAMDESAQSLLSRLFCHMEDAFRETPSSYRYSPAEI